MELILTHLFAFILSIILLYIIFAAIRDNKKLIKEETARRKILMNKNTVKIIRMEDDVILPKYETSLSVGMDIKANNDYGLDLEPGNIVIIPTGIKIELPDDIECQIRSRSGLSTRGIVVVNSPGTIDPDYRGEIKIILTNLGKENFVINKYDRIAQLVFAPIVRVKFDEVETFVETERGEGGFGSTGV